jgi:hypothetical protein
MQAIILSQFNGGGIANSKYSGYENSVARLVGFGIHEIEGVLVNNQKLTKESGTTIDGLARKILPCSDGSTYFFDSISGKIWKRTSAGVYSLAATASPAAGSANILDAEEYDGYIYYAMQSRLGRWEIGTDWSTRDDSYATFTNTNDTYHPMHIVNEVLYIGDGNLVAQVDHAQSPAFVADALDLADKYEITALGKFDTDLIIGASVSSLSGYSEIFRWNTWSVSYSNSDTVKEVAINAIIADDNYVLVQAGNKGNIYSYDGVQLQKLKRIKGTYSTTSYMKMYSNAWANFFGVVLMGISNGSGNPLDQGIYSYAQSSVENYKVLNLEFPISQVDGSNYSHVSNVEIGAIAVVGDLILVSWKDTTTGTVYGVDKLDYTAKQPIAIMESRVININRFMLNRYKKFIIDYETLPANTNIKLYYRKNHVAWVELTLVNDTARKQMIAELDLDGAGALELKLESYGSVNTTPIIEDITIFVE